MDQFKPSKSKALAAAGMQVANEKVGEIIGSLTCSYPQLAAILTFIQASFGISLAYKQEQLNQFTEFLMANQEIFTEDQLNKKEFQEGLSVWLNSYLKLRSDEKLSMAQNILIDFSGCIAMPLYPLERYDDTLEKISQSGLHFLSFICVEIPKLKQEYTLEKMKENKHEGNFAQWISRYGNKTLNFYIERYIKKQVALKMKDYSGDASRTDEKKITEDVSQPFSLVKSELEQLGLAVSGETSVGFGPGERFYALTDYGKKFVSIIKPQEIYNYTNATRD